ncbi:hypothetical protein CJU89_4148 [Yarrowia sp. B02]|nr:hypothetical protein CJU89_4148 [Yarrowia sp. B02]
MSSILAAELAKAKAKLEHEKIHGRGKKTEKKSAEEVTRNRGVEKRISHDNQFRVSKKSAQKTGYKNMQRKAELYRQFHQGEIDQLEGGVMERRDLVHNDEAGSRDTDDSEHDSDSSADSSEVEIVDEFGRTRMVPKRKRYLFEARKEVSREGYETSVAKSCDMVEKPANIIYGDVVQTDSFVRNDFVPQENETSTSHYDSTKEIRNRGVGFMQFSQDADVRERQQRELKEARAVTEAFVEEKKKEKDSGESHTPVNSFNSKEALDFLNLRYSQASSKAKQNSSNDKEGSVLYKPQAQAWSDGAGPNKTDFLSEFKKASDEFKD